MQDIFIKIYHALPQYEHQGLKTWVTRIAVNHAIDMVRKQRQHTQKKSAYANQMTRLQLEPSLDTPLLLQEQKETIRRRLQEVPDQYREVIIAHYLEEKSYQEIAEQLQIAHKTVEMRLYRARHWLRKHWKEEDF